MVIIFYVIQVFFGLFTGYISGQELDQEAEIMGTLFVSATLISASIWLFGGRIGLTHIFTTFLVWLLVAFITSEVMKLVGRNS